MTESNTGTTVHLTLTATLTYIVLVALIALAVIGAYVLQIFPVGIATAGVASGVLAFIGFLTQDLIGTPVPTGWPRYTTFLVVTVSAALIAGLGVVTSQTFVTLGGSVTWALFVVQYVINVLNSDVGVNIPASTEMEWVVGLGILVTLLTLVSTQSATDTSAVLTVTAAVAVPAYVHTREMANARAALARRASSR